MVSKLQIGQGSRMKKNHLKIIIINDSFVKQQSLDPATIFLWGRGGGWGGVSLGLFFRLILL